MGGFAGRKERGEMMHFYYILKNGKKEKKKVILMIFGALSLILTSSPTLGILQLFSY